MAKKLTEEERLDRDIEKAQAKVIRIHDKLKPIKEEYDQATEELSELLNIKNGIRDAATKEKFMEALRKSDRSFEDVLRFLDGTFDEW